MKRIVLVVICALLWNNVANAECAWLLWEKAEKTVFGKGTFPDQSITWDLVHAVPKFEQCLQLLNDAFERRSKFYTKAKSEGGFPGIEIKISPEQVLIMESGDGYFRSIVFKCLPDTIDPRK
jgi:hypothetical protein